MLLRPTNRLELNDKFPVLRLGREFVMPASQSDANIRSLCRRFGIGSVCCRANNIWIFRVAGIALGPWDIWRVEV